MSSAPRGVAGSRRRGRRRRGARRTRLALLLAGLVVVIAVIVVVVGGGGGVSHPPAPGAAPAAKPGDPFGYRASQQAEFVARATAGSAQVLFTKSPGGAMATASRVAAFRGMINQATAGTNIDPNLLEGLVFVESAGRSQIIAGSDPSAAAGLTQILAQTGQSLLGMHVDLARSRKLTAAIDKADDDGQTKLLARLVAQRAKADDRFNPRQELAGTIRYLQLADQRFGAQDLAIVSYHMGIGNLQHVLADYNGGHPVPYAQLYFDTAPDLHGTAYKLLAGLGDDSSLYYWRVLGAEQIMRLYRTDRGALTRLANLQTASDSNAEVLHPPDRTATFAKPSALAAAYKAHTIVPLPSNGATLGLAYDAGMGSLASKVGATVSLYRGLRPAALEMLIELAARVRAISGTKAPLTVAGTVNDTRYQGELGVIDPPASTGFSFQIARRYANGAQAEAFQAMLDRLQALNLIAWSRQPATIEVTVASDAPQAVAGKL